jgi:hypothetical protein
MRYILVVRAPDCQCTNCNGPGFDPSIRRHSGIWGAANEALLNIVGMLYLAPMTVRIVPRVQYRGQLQFTHYGWIYQVIFFTIHLLEYLLYILLGIFFRSISQLFFLLWEYNFVLQDNILAAECSPARETNWPSTYRTPVFFVKGNWNLDPVAPLKRPHLTFKKCNVWQIFSTTNGNQGKIP